MRFENGSQFSQQLLNQGICGVFYYIWPTLTPLHTKYSRHHNILQNQPLLLLPFTQCDIQPHPCSSQPYNPIQASISLLIETPTLPSQLWNPPSNPTYTLDGHPISSYPWLRRIHHPSPHDRNHTLLHISRFPLPPSPLLSAVFCALVGLLPPPQALVASWHTWSMKKIEQIWKT